MILDIEEFIACVVRKSEGDIEGLGGIIYPQVVAIVQFWDGFSVSLHEPNLRKKKKKKEKKKKERKQN